MFNNPFISHRRVYYADTDAGGIVYHANYLKFCEEARIELLRSLGVDRAVLAQENCFFVITQASLNYLKPAFLDDLLIVETYVTAQTRTRSFFKQILKREDQTLVEVTLVSACVNPQGRPLRMPACIMNLGKNNDKL